MEIDDIINLLSNSITLSTNDSFHIAGLCSIYLDSIPNEDDGRRIIINVLDNWKKIPIETHELWTDLIEIAGFYPYLEKDKDKLRLSSTSSLLRKEYHSSKNLKGKYFQEEQKKILDLLNKKKNLVVSAPTSFGKSLLIEEIVASKKFKNIVIIQPTLALLDETRKKLNKYSDNYKIIVRTSQECSDELGNLFLLTAERVHEYGEFPKIDFLVVDEFYKLSSQRGDTRADVLNNAFYRLYKKFRCQFYLLGPNIDNISPGFEKKYNAIFYKTNYSLVDCFVEDITDDKGNFIKNESEREKALFKLLESKINEQTIIYCSSPDRAMKIANKFNNHLLENKIKILKNNLPIIEWISENISRRWTFSSILKKRIGIHVGSLPKHITTSIIDYFNSNELSYLFCTTTIIEGVNTSAKNIVFYDKKKGADVPIDYFDYSNIKGRSGRLMIHYTGIMYNFNPIPQKNNLIIDIPFHQQNPINPEVLINIDDDDVIDRESSDFKFINSFTIEEKNLFKQNSITIQGQKELYDYLDKNIYKAYKYLNWTDFPTYEQLNFVIKLCWDYIKSSKEKITPVYSSKQLCKFTYDYVLNKQKLKDIIIKKYKEHKTSYTSVKNNEPPEWMKKHTINFYRNTTLKELREKSIIESFKLKKNCFEFKLPKWLKTIHSIQEYVCKKYNLKPGNYLHYSSLIENEFIPDNLAILTEYAIPISAIRKLGDFIPDDIEEDKILDYIKSKKILSKANLIDYEKEKVKINL